MYKAILLVLFALPLTTFAMNKKIQKPEEEGSILGTLTQEDFEEGARQRNEENKEFWKNIIYKVKPDFDPNKHTIDIFVWGMNRWFESLGFFARKAGSIDIRKPDWFEKHLAYYLPKITTFGNCIDIDVNHIEIEHFNRLPWMHQHPIKFAACAVGLTAITTGILGYWLGLRLQSR